MATGGAKAGLRRILDFIAGPNGPDDGGGAPAPSPALTRPEPGVPAASGDIGATSELIVADMRDLWRVAAVGSALPQRLERSRLAVEQALQELSFTRSRVDGLQASLAEERAARVKLKEDHARLTSDHERAQETLRALQTEVDDLRQRVARADLSKVKALEEVGDLTQKLAVLEPRLRDAQTAARTAAADVDSLRAERANLTNERDTLRLNLDTLSGQLRLKDDLVESGRRRIETQDFRVKELMALVSSLQTSLDAAVARASDVEGRLAVEQESARDLRTALERSIHERRETAAELEARLQTANSRADTVEAMLEDTRLRLRELTKLSAQQEQTLAARASEVEKLTRQNELLREENARISIDQRDYRGVLDVLKSDLEQGSLSFQKMERVLQKLEKEKADIVVERDALRLSLSAAEERHLQLNSVLNGQIAELMAQNDTLRAALEQARRNDAELDQPLPGTPRTGPGAGAGRIN